MTTVWDINLFYPLLFLLVIVAIVSISIVLIKIKDSNLFNNIFNRHVDEHIDTTSKFSKSHTEIVAGLPIVYHKEFHNLEQEVKNNHKYMIEIATELNQKMDKIIERISVLEKTK